MPRAYDNDPRYFKDALREAGAPAPEETRAETDRRIEAAKATGELKEPSMPKRLIKGHIVDAPPLTFRQLQEEQAVWAQRNFPDQFGELTAEEVHRKVEAVTEDPKWDGSYDEAVAWLITSGRLGKKKHHGLLGAVEEVGELCHAFLKFEQGIRGYKDGGIMTGKCWCEIEDALGDINIFLVSFCNTHGFDYQQCVERAWEEVRQRDWVRWPETGRPPEKDEPESRPVLETVEVVVRALKGEDVGVEEGFDVPAPTTGPDSKAALDALARSGIAPSRPSQLQSRSAKSEVLSALRAARLALEALYALDVSVLNEAERAGVETPKTLPKWHGAG